MENYIKIWRFEDAPKEYQDLSEHGGDEDYIAYIPKDLDDSFWWIEDKLANSVDRYEFDTYIIYIGAHA